MAQGDKKTNIQNMARSINDYTGIKAGVSTDYPYNRIKDQALGNDGTDANEKSNGDLQQFFQRLMDTAGITPNGVPDNVTNGFQLSQALNTLFGRADSALAATVGATDFTQPVVVSGMVLAVGVTNTTITAGYCYYNGQLVYCPAGSTPNAGFGSAMYVNITQVDTLAFAGIRANFDTTPNGAGTFKYSTMVSYAQGLGGKWISAASLTYGTSWSNVNLKYRINAMGEVQFCGSVRSTGTTPSTTILTMPSGFIAAVSESFICGSAPFPSGAATYCHIGASSGGGIMIDSTDIGSSITVALSPVRYSTY